LEVKMQLKWILKNGFVCCVKKQWVKIWCVVNTEKWVDESCARYCKKNSDTCIYEFVHAKMFSFLPKF
jgi:hypothetical protein